MSWDDDDDVDVKLPQKNDWDDEEDTVKAAWDAPDPEPEQAPTEVKTEKSRPDRPKEKAKEKKKLLAGKDAEGKKPSAASNLTGDEKLAHKLAQEKLVKDADAENVLDAFAGFTTGDQANNNDGDDDDEQEFDSDDEQRPKKTAAKKPVVAKPANANNNSNSNKALASVDMPLGGLEGLATPETSAQVVKYARDVAGKLLEVHAKNSEVYLAMMKVLMDEVLKPMTADEVKDFSAKINIIHSAKVQATKDKKKPKKKGPTIGKDVGDIYDDYKGFKATGTGAGTNDYDDFM
eukprot:c20790_g3_i1.p1 GENE.c20790_g3_i1~~c20790_g3_i1.p1  ORF type:complete len:308 (+),score=103.91 c20790_g3_i1:53-925(+)